MSDAPQSPLPLLDPDRVVAIAADLGDDIEAITRQAVSELDFTGFTATGFDDIDPINQAWYTNQVKGAIARPIMNAAASAMAPLTVDVVEDTTGQVEIASDEWLRAVAIGQVCHAANRAWQIVSGDPVVSDAWEDTSEEIQRSTVEGVLKALEGATPEQLHETWCTFKTEHGWVYGPAKDAEAKTHPNLVPYAELPESDRKKDDLFQAIAAALGNDIVDQRVAIANEAADRLFAATVLLLGTAEHLEFGENLEDAAVHRQMLDKVHGIFRSLDLSLEATGWRARLDRVRFRT